MALIEGNAEMKKRNAPKRDENAELRSRALAALPRGSDPAILDDMHIDEISALARVTELRTAKPEAPAVAGAQKTKPDRVASPTVPGAIENISRVVDTIDQMYKRRQLADDKDIDDKIKHNERAYRAVQRLRGAHDVVYGSIGGVMDFDRVRGAGSPGSPPPLHYRMAADILIDTKKGVDALQLRIITLVACEGHSIDQTAQKIYGREVSRSEREEIGKQLREGLRELAKRWFEATAEGKRTKIVTHHAADAHPDTVKYTTDVGTIQRGKTVTATRNRIHRN